MIRIAKAPRTRRDKTRRREHGRRLAQINATKRREPSGLSIAWRPSGIVIGGLLVGDDRLALRVVIRMVGDRDDTSALFHCVSIARLMDCMAVVWRMPAVVRDYTVQ